MAAKYMLIPKFDQPLWITVQVVRMLTPRKTPAATASPTTSASKTLHISVIGVTEALPGPGNVSVRSSGSVSVRSARPVSQFGFSLETVTRSRTRMACPSRRAGSKRQRLTTSLICLPDFDPDVRRVLSTLVFPSVLTMTSRTPMTPCRELSTAGWATSIGRGARNVESLPRNGPRKSGVDTTK
jgi:hypothetical protein